MPESVFRLFGDDLNPIFQQNHQNFGSHHCHKSTRSLTNYIDFPKIGSRVRFPRLHMKICNGRIDFKFSLKQCSYILVCGKNTFGAIADHEKGVNNFPHFFCNVCRIPLLTYMEMEICLWCQLVEHARIAPLDSRTYDKHSQKEG